MHELVKAVERLMDRDHVVPFEHCRLVDQRDLDAALEALRLSSGGQGWQDIATAPRDGTAIFAGSVNHTSREVVCWQDGVPSGSLDSDKPQEGWVNEGPYKDRFHANPRYFTHWKPLPEPPSVGTPSGVNPNPSNHPQQQGEKP